MKGYINYDKDACIIQCISEEFDINELEPFLQYIRADNGEDWIHISSEEDFKTLSFNNFEAIPGENDNTFYIHYNAEIEIDLDSLEEFRAALDYSIDEVVGQVGFKKDGRILEHSLLFDGWNDEIVCLF